MKKTLLLTITTFLIAATVLAAPLLSFVVDGVRLSREEMTNLSDLRSAHQRVLSARSKELETFVDLMLRIRDKETAAVAQLPAGAKKTSREEGIAAITAGATRAAELLVDEIEDATTSVPTPLDVRKLTVGQFYDTRNPEAPVLLGNRDNNDTLNLSEAGIPAFIFNQIDTSGDGEISLAEAGAYLASL